MSIDQSCVWEFRPGTGSNDNGGGFASAVASAVGTDYSQQASCVIEVSDFKMAAAGTFASSPTGTFTSAMTGNVFYLRGGTNFTSGFYCITSWTASTNVDIDRNAVTGSAAATSATISVGGARAVWTNVVLASTVVAGNTVWVKNDGDMTLTESVSTQDGAATTFINYTSYASTRGDFPVGSNRVTIAIGANAISYGTFNIWENFRMTGTSSTLFVRSADTARNAYVSNCYFLNNSGTASRSCISAQNNFYMLCSELSSTLGTAIANGGMLYFCYIHDSATGISSTARATDINNCIIESCTTGLTYGSQSFRVVNSVIYGCTTGMTGTTGGSIGHIFNTIIANCTTGFTLSTANSGDGYLLLYNCWNNTTDIGATTGLSIGENDIVQDPLFTDAANGDFTLQSTSPCVNTGLAGSNIGLTGNYMWNRGYAQDDNQTGGTGGGQVGRVYAY